ncbi:efflux RND transporter periplasmic adaptor subunit [Nevskia sp.]|uniref:efflux RND transporter periplasmic adaptor subunit n=1 Tax=Nevskia sp. TaxID=1929292 RepID=UPI003F7086C5
MKRWLTLIGVVVVLILVIGGIKALQVKKTLAGYAAMPEPQSAVSTAKAEFQDWSTELPVVGSLRAVRGVELANELAGTVEAVGFRSGEDVKAGAPLLQLVADADRAKLRSLEANAELAALNATRDKLQFEAEAISRAAYENSVATAKSAKAAVEEQRALVAKMAIRAPFAGRLGISTVNRGQYLAAGANVVTLQQLDPIYADFNLPQQQLAQLKVGETVKATIDSFPGTVFEGTISAINPIVDTETRNVRVQATIANPEQRLLPGMFADLRVSIGKPQRYLTLPQTAITFNPYGETVFVVVKRGEENAPDPNLPATLAKNQALDKIDAEQRAADAAKAAAAKGEKAAAAPAAAPAKPVDPNAPPVLVARQVFVVSGPKRGDQVAILSGLKEGDEVVTTGQLKLRNGTRVNINNAVQPSFDANPQPKDQ